MHTILEESNSRSVEPRDRQDHQESNAPSETNECGYTGIYFGFKLIALITTLIMMFLIKPMVPKGIHNIGILMTYNFIMSITLWTLMAFNTLIFYHDYGRSIKISELVWVVLEFIVFVSNITITICIVIIYPLYNPYTTITILACYVGFSIILIGLLKKYKRLKPRIVYE